MILFLSIKHTINIVIIRYIVYDDICLMVRKINYFIYYYFITFTTYLLCYSLSQLLATMLGQWTTVDLVIGSSKT
jgi:hypothetical protein